jgi:hypothetical protein
MFTQAMPAYIDALRQAVPANAVGPMAQALGNCAQPLTHRGGINFAAPQRPNQNGTFNGGAWNPADYQNLFPGGGGQNSSNYQNQVDLGGMNVTWNEGNRYDGQFFFPINAEFTSNNFFGGPTVHVSGGQQIDYITNEYFDGDTVNVQNLTTQVINGDPVAGPQGAPGAAGRDGQRGAPGAPGGFFGFLPPGRFAPIRYLTGKPEIKSVPVPVAKPHRYIKDAWIRPSVTVAVPTNAISAATVTVAPSAHSFQLPTNAIAGGTLTLSPEPVAVTIPLTISFDAEACSVSIDSTTTVYCFPSLPSYQTLSGTAATSQTVTVASTDTVTATVTGVAASAVTVIAATTAASTVASHVPSTGFVVKGLDAQFWERNPGFENVVKEKPTVIGTNQVEVRVYRE